MLTKNQLLRALDPKALEAAIASVEVRTTGEVRLCISRWFWGSPEGVAWHTFDRLGMRSTAHRNAVLLFVAPARRRFVLVADDGFAAKCPDPPWPAIARDLSAAFAAARYQEGLLSAIAAIGEVLAASFPADATPGSMPAQPPNPNELADAVLVT